MKIARVEPFHVEWGAGRNRSAWVRIWTDAGAYGLGEASPMVHGNASLEIIASAFTPVLLGADPLEPRVIQDRLFHEHIKVGPEGAYAGALAAIDIALWDLRGKVLGQPVWKLLGGAWRRELPFYASIGGNSQRSVDEVCRVVEKWLELGPAQVKIRFDADKTARDLDLAGDIAKARAVRTLVGDGFPLAFDSNNGYSVQGAIRLGRALEELGYVWFEEPVQHYHVESFAKVAAALDIAVSAGEQEYTLQGIKRLIEAGVDIVQPDIVKTGGFTGLGDMAAGSRLRRRFRAAPDAALDRAHRQPALGGVGHPLAPPSRVQRATPGAGRRIPNARATRQREVRALGRAGARARARRDRAAKAHDPLDLVSTRGPRPVGPTSAR